MSKNKKLDKTKAKKNIYKHTGIINCKGIYIHAVKGKDGKRQHKKSCLYYDVDTENCMNNNCSSTVCYTAHNFTEYRRKEKEVKSKLSDYDETYIQKPFKASIHEPDNRYIRISRNIGTPMHGEYLKSDGIRRHKARCIYYNKVGKLCNYFVRKCLGTSRCNEYKEK